MNDTLRTLTKQDLAMFKRFRIPTDLVKDAHVNRVTGTEARRDLYLTAPRRCSLAGLAFLYPSPEDEGRFLTCRVRRDNPEIKDGKPVNKYMSPKGGPRCLYRPPGTAERLRDQSTPIVLVEAEKSALTLTAYADRQNRNLVALATGGCWGWSQDGAPLPDLESCRGRQVIILFDANAATNANVQKARAALVWALRRMGCEVLIAHLPQVEGVNGPDDLVATENGDAKLANVLSDARSAVIAEHSDDALAARFAAQYSCDLRYVQAIGRWFVWDGRRWAADETQTTASLVQKLCEAATLECDSLGSANRIRSARTRAAVQQEASVHGRLAATLDQWDNDSMLLNTPSGTIDLKTRELRPHRREDFCTKMTAVAPGLGRPTRWLLFLQEVTQGNHELQSYLQRVAGYCLSGDTSEHALFFLYGTGANGKSVFVSTLLGMMGDYARVASMETFTASHNAQHPTDLAGLRGARLVAATETEDGSRWAESKLKAITGGERIAARKMRQDFFEYTPQFKLLLSGNHQPRLRNIDEAMRRRINLVPFVVTFPVGRRDLQLAEKLRQEWPGILRWAVEGYPVWKREGLRPPEAVTEATRDYLEGQDLIGQWMAERTAADKNSRTKPSELYRNFWPWADEHGEKYVWSQKEFSQKLAERGYPAKKSHGDRYVALRLLDRARLEETGTVAANRKFDGKALPMRK